MNREINSVGMTPMPGHQWPVGVAYVAIPSDIERDVYIRECYMTNKISVWTEDGSFFSKAPCNIDLFNWIEFPDSFDEFGSAVVYVTEPIHKQPIIIARLPKIDELGDLQEHQFKMRRRLGSKMVEISGSPKSNSLNLVVDSKSESGSINIVLENDNDNGEVNLSVAGDLSIEVVGDTEILQGERLLIKTSEGKDGEYSSYTQTKEGHKFEGRELAIKTSEGEDGESSSYKQSTRGHEFEGEKFVVNKGEEPMVLGNKVVSFLSKFIDEVANIKTTTQLGPMPILNIAQVMALKSELKDILSDQGFLKE